MASDHDLATYKCGDLTLAITCVNIFPYIHLLMVLLKGNLINMCKVHTCVTLGYNTWSNGHSAACL